MEESSPVKVSNELYTMYTSRARIKFVWTTMYVPSRISSGKVANNQMNTLKRKHMQCDWRQTNNRQLTTAVKYLKRATNRSGNNFQSEGQKLRMDYSRRGFRECVFVFLFFPKRKTWHRKFKPSSNIFTMTWKWMRNISRCVAILIALRNNVQWTHKMLVKQQFNAIQCTAKCQYREKVMPLQAVHCCSQLLIHTTSWWWPHSQYTHICGGSFIFIFNLRTSIWMWISKSKQH